MDDTSTGLDNLFNTVYGGGKMRIYDNVELNTELNELAAKGIHKGCTGLILDVKADMCFVYFRNRKNMGDYACTNVNKKYLEFYRHEQKENIPNWERFKKTGDLKKDSFKLQKFIEYDLVELRVEKEKYAKFGVHKGMQGVVMENYCIDSDYYVIFTDGATAEDIADIPVHEDDLILINRICKNKP